MPGRYVSMWRKNEQGAWRCFLEIHSPRPVEDAGTQQGRVMPNSGLDFDSSRLITRIGGGAMDGEANKALISRIADDIWNRGDLAAVDDVMAADARYHGPHMPSGVEDCESWRRAISM